jgi:hypothetical protein
VDNDYDHIDNIQNRETDSSAVGRLQSFILQHI